MKTNKFLVALATLSVPIAITLTGCSNKGAAPVDSGTAAGHETTTPAPDNSAKNERDRHDATLTPEDQGGSTSDREVTQKVRKSLVSGDHDYSTTAKNIKIITTGGKVTLRGPVKTEAEKSGIVSIAKGVAGEGNVDDQLEVK